MRNSFTLLQANSSLLNPRVVYNTWGVLNAAKDNCIVCCHALTANSKVQTYWPSMLGHASAEGVLVPPVDLRSLVNKMSKRILLKFVELFQAFAKQGLVGYVGSRLAMCAEAGE